MRAGVARTRKWSLGRSRSVWKDKVRVLEGAGQRPFSLALRTSFSLSLSRSCSLSYTLSTPPARFFMAWIASGVSSHTQKAWSFHVARRVALSYRRSHNSLFYLISSLVDRLPLDHFRHQGFTTVMATRKKPGWHRHSGRTPWKKQKIGIVKTHRPYSLDC